MKCPFCSSSSRVIDSRPISEGIRRRRVCDVCHRRFTTHERMVPLEVKVIKNGDRAPELFDVKKIIATLQRICQGCAVTDHDIEALAHGIETDLLREEKTTVHSSEIARRVIDRLEEIDRLAYHRFSADYRDAEGHLTVKILDEAPVELVQYELFE